MASSVFSHATKFPPATHVFRPERKDRPPGLLDHLLRTLTGGFQGLRHVRDGRMPAFVSRVEDYGRKLAGAKGEDLKSEADRLRGRLRVEGLKVEPVTQAFALVREASTRVLGMRHFDTQLVGGWVVLKGGVAEMETGEGKTLTATLAAGAAALAGIPVHVITVNDYLTGRDAEWMGPVYGALGLKVGCIVHGMTPEARRAAYGCDVTYCTNKEVAFDYLRDWLTLEGTVNPLRLQAEYLYGHEARVRRLLLRGLHYAIVDEADSVLIDEARTPLIISGGAGGEGREERAFLEQAIALARRLEAEVDYRVDKAPRKVELTAAGKARIREWSLPLGPLWTGTVRREEIVRLGLSALHLFKRDEEYLVRDGKVQIVDEFTGRVMADRSYEGGLHQLIEIKEGCKITRRPETMARISYQRFFRRYLHLAGMTGTAREVRAELWSVYGLPVVPIPTCREMRRMAYPDRVFLTEKEKWRVVAERVGEIHEKGRPVLIGTRSVAASEKTSGMLSGMGLAHQVLNAKQDREEAEIISRAGGMGCITIATNMAGRGTDIRLGPGVEEKGGLHVILTERHEAGRIDRQLAGRCGRLGDPGSHEAILSLEDPIVRSRGCGIAGRLARRFPVPRSSVWTWLAKRGIVRAQKGVERLHFRVRKSLLREDERRGDMLSFSGRAE
ncbi:MAG: preprotein translocase subunit SecA [Thermodesulfobacteriota bacterium]